FCMWKYKNKQKQWLLLFKVHLNAIVVGFVVKMQLFLRLLRIEVCVCARHCDVLQQRNTNNNSSKCLLPQLSLVDWRQTWMVVVFQLEFIFI
ncbi:hypothetical protein DOY81_003348, partial [Sarcophaga bullata]